MKRFLLALTLVACMGAVTACGGGAAQKKRVGIQLYSLHQDMGNVEASLQRLADIGYTSVETLNGNGDPNCFGMSPADFKALCDKVGLTITSTHASIQNDPANEEAVMERWRVLFDALRTMGAKYCIMPGYAFGSTLEEIAASCDYCNRVGKLATEYGLKLGYHNHAGDFVQVEGQTVLDYVLAHTDPELFLLELDVANMGGADPMYYLTQYPDRVRLLHVKDERVLGRSGKIDFEAIFNKYYANGYGDYYVEFELPFTIGEDAAENERNLAELWQGLAECYDYLQSAPFVK